MQIHRLGAVVQNSVGGKYHFYDFDYGLDVRAAVDELD